MAGQLAISGDSEQIMRLGKRASQAGLLGSFPRKTTSVWTRKVQRVGRQNVTSAL